ncbi:hotdog fold thioesterase [Teredinibacter turnerae]|uniref:hotdog fold thioesterase n=1 Tax=Teredinibacter turnerae TaxID=2426 RepID=UPI0030CB8E30
MSIWKKPATLEQINKFGANTLVSHLGIEVTAIGDSTISATMPVADHTRQPLGYLHGGASVVLAETLGSIAAHLAAEEGMVSFGAEINANHLRSVRSGTVMGVASPLRIGSSMQVWDIRITDDNDELICISRLTAAIRPQP